MITPNIRYFEFYDTETSGVNPSFDQIYQLASVTTDSELNVIEGTDKNILCRPRPDVIPHPKAFLTHMLDMDVLVREGISEYELSQVVSDIFLARDQTAISGYNSDSFDNEMVRNLLYRNMMPAYDHEWKNKNTKFDVFKLVQLVYAMRPEVLEWRSDDAGLKSTKLEDLTFANNIPHGNAHDALSDVLATIGVAKLIKERAPKIFDYALKMCNKGNVNQLLSRRVPLIQVSTMYGKQGGYSSLIQPIVQDTTNANEFMCVDLAGSPELLLELTAEDINRYMFTRRADLPTDAPKIPLASVKANKQPMILASEGMVSNEYLERTGIDMDRVRENIAFVEKNRSAIGTKIREAKSLSAPSDSVDPHRALYSGSFPSRGDQEMYRSLHEKIDDIGSPALSRVDCYKMALQLDDYDRAFHLMHRSKWNNFYKDALRNHTSTPEELLDYNEYLSKRINGSLDESALGVQEYREISGLCRLEEPLTEQQEKVLDSVDRHIEKVVSLAKLVDSKSTLMFSQIQEGSLQNPQHEDACRLRDIVDKKHEFEESGALEP